MGRTGELGWVLDDSTFTPSPARVNASSTSSCVSPFDRKNCIRSTNGTPATDSCVKNVTPCATSDSRMLPSPDDMFAPYECSASLVSARGAGTRAWGTGTPGTATRWLFRDAGRRVL